MDDIKQNIKVMVRLRPFLNFQDEQDSIVEVNESQKEIQIKDQSRTRVSTFDFAISPSQTQQQVFHSIKDTLQQVQKGYNISILAYGQTGSGQTYTMFGADWESINLQYNEPKLRRQSTVAESLESDSNYSGLIPRTIHEIFNLIQYDSEDLQVYCSFLQIYNQKIFDLLNDSKPRALQIHENKYEGIYVEGLSEYQTNQFQETLQLMKRGEKNRQIRQTMMNAQSSRSHTIFQLLIQATQPDSRGFIRRGQINMCDLAGSEKINQSEMMVDAHLLELKNINLSLTTLGKVIHNLSQGSQLPVPYRESKLTRLLQDSLGGNTITYVIANISPSKQITVLDRNQVFKNIQIQRYSIEETLSTLQFAERARHIILKIQPNSINAADDATVQKLQQQINYLKELLNIKKSGQGKEDLNFKLISLLEENEQLQSRAANKDEIQKLMEENRKLQKEMEKLSSISKYTNEPWSINNEPQKLMIKQEKSVTVGAKAHNKVSQACGTDDHDQMDIISNLDFNVQQTDISSDDFDNFISQKNSQAIPYDDYIGGEGSENPIQEEITKFSVAVDRKTSRNISEDRKRPNNQIMLQNNEYMLQNKFQVNSNNIPINNTSMQYAAKESLLNNGRSMMNQYFVPEKDNGNISTIKSPRETRNFLPQQQSVNKVLGESYQSLEINHVFNSQREVKKEKEKLKILKRLDDLQRIELYNQIQLKRDLEVLDNNNQKPIRFSSPSTASSNKDLENQQKKLETYGKQIERLQKLYL